MAGECVRYSAGHGVQRTERGSHAPQNATATGWYLEPGIEWDISVISFVAGGGGLVEYGTDGVRACVCVGNY